MIVLPLAYSSTSGTHLLPDLLVLRGVGRFLPSASSASASCTAQPAVRVLQVVLVELVMLVTISTSKTT